MSQELTTTTNQSNEVAQYADQTGLEDAVHLKPTKLQLIQGTTRDSKGARPGQILDVMNEVGYDEITVVPLKVNRSRVMFPPGKEDFTAEPICRSSDAITPSPFAQIPQAVTCKSCPNSQWTGKKRPVCDEKLNLLVIIKELGIPRYFQVGGVGIKSLKLTLQRIFEDIQINRMKGTLLSLFDYFFTLRSEKVVGQRGVYYVPRFDNLKKVLNPSEFGPLFEKFVVNVKSQYEEDEAVVTNENIANGAVDQIVDAEIVTEV